MPTKPPPPSPNLRPVLKWRWLPVSWRMALAELQKDRSLTLAYTISLGLGLLGLLAIDTLQRSFARHLDQGSRSLLGADLMLSAPREITDEERALAVAALPMGTKLREEIGMMSMLTVAAASGAGNTATRLVELRAVDAAFPFYGSLELRRLGALGPGAGKVLATKDSEVWVHPELLLQMNLALGAKVLIGGQEFTISDEVLHDPSMSAVAFAIAPKVYLAKAAMERLELIQKGSRVFRGLYFQLEGDLSLKDRDASRFAEQLRAHLKATDLRIRTHRQASSDDGRLLLYVQEYLGLIALVSLFLAGLAIAYLQRGFLEKRARSIAILASVGAKRALIFRIYLFELVILGALAATFALFGIALVTPFLPHLLGGLMPQGVAIEVSLSSVVFALLLAIGASVLLGLPLLTKLRHWTPVELFRDVAKNELKLSARDSLHYLPALVLLWLLASWQASSWRIGSLFMALFGGAALLGLGFAMLQLRLLKGRLRMGGNRVFWLASHTLARRPAASLSFFSTISLGALLVALVPTLRATLTADLDADPRQPRPSLFLFDIQDDQLSALENLLQEQGLLLMNRQPMVRAQLQSINGEKPQAQGGATREAQEAERSQSRGLNLSYRAELGANDEVVAGQFWQGPHDMQSSSPIALSLEARYAKRMGVTLGDSISFDVGGVFITGVVQSIRRVRWTSFMPNFFLLVQPGVLEDAPKTHLMALGTMSDEQKALSQNLIVRNFPNVSIIDVSQTIARIAALAGQITQLVLFMAGSVLLSGLLVLFVLVRREAQQRSRDVALLKSLGADFKTVRRAAALEFVAQGLMAAVFAIALSFVLASILAHVLFERQAVLDVWTPLALIILLPLTTAGVGVLASASALRQKPRSLLGVG